MKKHTYHKTVLAVSLLVLFTITMVAPLTAFAYLPPDYSYTLLNGGAVVIDCRFKESPTVKIPQTIDGHTVVGIGSKALRNSRGIEEIILPDTVTFLEEYAFAGLTDLKKIHLSSSLENIPSFAFDQCTNLSRLDIPSKVNDISSYAFHTCNIENITVSPYNEYYTAINGVLFAADKTTLIYCPQEKTGEYTIPNTVKTIGDNAFYCSKLTAINIPNSVTTIGNSAFYCSEIKSFYLPDSITYIGDDAFKSNTDMESIAIPKSINELYSDTFDNCRSLKEITILSDEFTFDFSTLEGTKLQKINVPDTHKKYSSVDGVLFNKSKTTLVYFPQGRTEAYIVPDGVTTIDTNAFYNSKIQNVTLPDTLVRINNSAFFNSCITNITLPKSVTWIGDMAFLECYIESVDIHENITYIGERAFEGDRFKAFNVSESNPKYSSIDGVLFSKSKTHLFCFPNKKTSRSDTYTIPTGTIKVSSRAFHASTLDTIIIPESVTTLGDNAFENCKVKNIVVPDSVTSIGSGAFDVFSYRNNRLTIYAPLNSLAYTYAVNNKLTVITTQDGSEQSAVTPEPAIPNSPIKYIVIVSVAAIVIVAAVVIIVKCRKNKKA